nr:hypothetical protein [uncultured Hyphomonas sp.]
MRRRIAGKPLQIIEDDDVIFALLRIEIRQQRDHARAFEVISTASNRVRKNRFNLIAFLRRILTAAILLRVQSITIRGLFQ